MQLMCRNAMVYNRPETIYYKAAKKLLHAALKITSADKLRAYSPLQPILAELTPEQLGFELDSSAAQSEEEDEGKVNPSTGEVPVECKIKLEPSNEDKATDAAKQGQNNVQYVTFMVMNCLNGDRKCGDFMRHDDAL